MTTHEIPLGPLGGSTIGKLRIEGGDLVIAVPLRGEQRVPLAQIVQVEIDRPSKWSIQSRKRTMVLHGQGGEIARVDAVGKHGDRAYEWLSAALPRD